MPCDGVQVEGLMGSLESELISKVISEISDIIKNKNPAGT